MKCSIDRETLGLSAEAAKEWQQHTEREFRLWAGKKQNCDALGLNNFESLQQLALISWLMNGDSFALIKQGQPTRMSPYTLRIHLVEADRVATPGKMVGSILGFGTEGQNPDHQREESEHREPHF